jgi:hypothetical protein
MIENARDADVPVAALHRAWCYWASKLQLATWL